MSRLRASKSCQQRQSKEPVKRYSKNSKRQCRERFWRQRDGLFMDRLLSSCSNLLIVLFISRLLSHWSTPRLCSLLIDYCPHVAISTLVTQRVVHGYVMKQSEMSSLFDSCEHGKRLQRFLPTRVHIQLYTTIKRYVRTKSCKWYGVAIIGVHQVHTWLIAHPVASYQNSKIFTSTKG